MTSSLSDLRLVDFTNAAPSTLQRQVIDAIDAANHFLDNLTALTDTAAMSAEQALTDVMRFDHINLALDRSWGILSHLNGVMSNDEIRQVHHELLPKLSAYGTKVSTSSWVNRLGLPSSAGVKLPTMKQTGSC